MKLKLFNEKQTFLETEKLKENLELRLSFPQGRVQTRWDRGEYKIV